MIKLATAEESAPAMVQPEQVLDFFKADSGFQSSRLSSESMANSGMAAEKNVIIYVSSTNTPGAVRIRYLLLLLEPDLCLTNWAYVSAGV